MCIRDSSTTSTPSFASSSVAMASVRVSSSLSAISLPSYGLDTGTNLVELVEKCAQVSGIERIRLGLSLIHI